MSGAPVEVTPQATLAAATVTLLDYVVKAKAAWHAHQVAMSWEEKIAAIERMRERSAQLSRARLMAPLPP